MRILVDPGHGGVHPGCIHHGIVEKDFNLQIGLMLRVALTQLGFDVKMTRQDDSFRSLHERGALSGDCQFALSIHADSSPKPEVGKLSGYCMPLDAVGRACVVEVERMAPMLLRPRTPEATLCNSGDWTQRAYHVLRAHEGRPCALIECAFLSNPVHAAYVQTEAGQDAIVSALSSGIVATVAAQVSMS